MAKGLGTVVTLGMLRKRAKDIKAKKNEDEGQTVSVEDEEAIKLAAARVGLTLETLTQHP